MSHYLNQTAKAVLEDYQGDINNLRDSAKHDPVKERELVKKFKVRTTQASICRSARMCCRRV